jgi:hypothetical protein
MDNGVRWRWWDFLAFLVLVYVPFRLMPDFIILWLLPYAGRYAYTPTTTAAAPPPSPESAG